MRLSRIKIAGFKSFVDPTDIKLPSSLVGIVGPNGCGKSNTIDAVRWVMGESSAKHLRGESMDDVIFVGSSTRKPVGKASVELVFDNADGSLGGEYAQYAEISIRREVERDGQSKYLLNNVRCRRRDIRDIFLGTGLGPRSYAIIEQGMISRLIEAKPEDLRGFLEEAAGISKYKERRKETETRIRHTRENLDRLDDLREEVDKQLAHLQRQANTAERYQRLKAEERQKRGELLVLRRREFEDTRDEQGLKTSELEKELEGVIAELRAAESAIELARSQQSEAS
ncbi:MAG: chromosome segregation protein, partial [Gammaproteobacteria bacterium]